MINFFSSEFCDEHPGLHKTGLRNQLPWTGDHLTNIQIIETRSSEMNTAVDIKYSTNTLKVFGFSVLSIQFSVCDKLLRLLEKYIEPSQSCSSAISGVDDRRLDELLGDGIKGQLITENKVSSKILATMLIKILSCYDEIYPKLLN